MKQQKVIVFSGAGMSAESGLKTFRDSGGLWENYDISEVATPEAWYKNPKLVLEFYNKRRQQIVQAMPNAAHHALVKLEKQYDVQVITQNIDDLHERAGSKNVLHLHGEIKKAQSSLYPDLVYDIEDGKDLKMGDLCEKGCQLRPHVVWFGEAVPNMEKAYEIIGTADIVIIIGTSLNVYPAAGIIHFAPETAKKFLIDPGNVSVQDVENLEVIKDKAGSGAVKLVEQLTSQQQPTGK